MSERQPHDAPSAIELVEAVREFLEGDVTDATDGQVRFHARVAARLAIVERELASADRMAADHAVPGGARVRLRCGAGRRHPVRRLR